MRNYEQKGSLFMTQLFKEHPTILAIMFWNFTIFQYTSDSPQVKGNLISSIVNLVYVLLHELPNELPMCPHTHTKKKKLGNIRKISNLGGHIIYCLVAIRKLRLCQQQLKNTQKHIPNFSFPAQFCRVTPFCSKYFVRD